MVFIYALSDPRTGECRYIGRTLHVKNRVHSHLVRPAKTMRPWIESLGRRKPAVTILQKVPRSQQLFWEAAYIRAYRKLGANLLNQTHKV